MASRMTARSSGSGPTISQIAAVAGDERGEHHRIDVWNLKVPRGSARGQQFVAGHDHADAGTHCSTSIREAPIALKRPRSCGLSTRPAGQNDGPRRDIFAAAADVSPFWHGFEDQHVISIELCRFDRHDRVGAGGKGAPVAISMVSHAPTAVSQRMPGRDRATRWNAAGM